METSNNNIKTSQKITRWRMTSSERHLLLIAGDIITAVIALVAALYYWSMGDNWYAFSLEFVLSRPPFWYFFLPLLWLLLLMDIYDIRRASRLEETMRTISMAAGVFLVFYLFIYFTSEPNSLPRRGVAGFIVAIFFLTTLWRITYIRVFTAPAFMRRVLVVGAGRAGQTIVEVVKKITPPPFFLVGLIDDDPEKIGTQLNGCPILGGGEDILRLISSENVTDLVLAISGEMNTTTFQALLKAEESGIEVTTMPRMYEDLLNREPIFLLQSDWIFRSFADQAHLGGLYEIAKRMIDITGGVIGCLILGVLFPIISLAIWIESGRPILFIQNRLGKSGQIFKVFKFRTMFQDAEADGKARVASKNDERITRIGKFLRMSHLDEFPQFVNVLMGDMSLVGPRSERPQIAENLEKKVPFFRARLFVKPGITGWAQVNFGYATTLDDMATKLEYDLYYIKHRNLLLDIVIMIRTIGTVVGFRGQ